jgi:mannose-6-phosphate isomerase-like protein (cupin superfamily)
MLKTNPIKKFSPKPTYKQKGVAGYKFSLKNKIIEVYFVNVLKGHDNYLISKKITHTYYILQGQGTFDINGKIYKVKTGNLIETEPKVEYTYSGKMKMLLIMTPPFFKGNDIKTRSNPYLIKGII